MLAAPPNLAVTTWPPLPVRTFIDSISYSGLTGRGTSIQLKPHQGHQSSAPRNPLTALRLLPVSIALLHSG